jgi:hypothetical protein
LGQLVFKLRLAAQFLLAYCGVPLFKCWSLLISVYNNLSLCML